MADKNVAFPFKDQQDYLDGEFAKKANVVVYSGTFTSGTSKTSDTGLEEVVVGTIVLANSKAYVATAINSSTKVITALQISNA